MDDHDRVETKIRLFKRFDGFESKFDNPESQN